MKTSAIDLINRQKVEIDSLRADLNNFIKTEAIKEFAESLNEKKQEVFTAVNEMRGNISKKGFENYEYY